MSSLRLLKIIWVFGRYRLDTLLDISSLPWYVRIAIACFPLRWFFRATGSNGRRLRLALEHLGPVFVKFGQILSTRRDLLPEDMATELAFLQDRVAPFSSDLAIKTIEKAHGRRVTETFARFDNEPLASASIAQVHTAALHNGAEVVVKVIRPNIEPTIRKDVRLMHLLARLLELSTDGRRLRPVEVVEDFKRTILDEFDLLREAANASMLRRNSLEEGKLYVPWVDFELTKRSVLVMERIYGVPIADIDALKAKGTDMSVLAERGVEIFFSQVFKDSFFHADMHPGNIFVDISDPAQPKYIGIDCGIVGSLSREDQAYLAQNLLAFFNRDYYRVAQLHVESGWVPSTTRVNEFEAAIRSVCEPIFEKPLGEISFGLLLIRLFQTARRYDMTVQPQLVLLQKTLLNIEGLGRQLYPQLDLWKTAKPFLEQWVKDQVGPKRFFETIKQHAPSWIAKAPEMPDLIHTALTQVQLGSRSEQNIADHLAQMEKQAQVQRKKQRRRWLAVVVVGIAIVVPNAENWMPSLNNSQWLAVVIGVLLFLWP
ncbi:ubiquinone biosynthesis regulatory protein kinase UbiB [Reinekea sp.]|uniref:ubiquinone biosynthesis regulatory protein kinase UbiB n=1 Tax=Reinekea sp. TaxID=1970455 RepID=UPI00398930EC